MKDLYLQPLKYQRMKLKPLEVRKTLSHVREQKKMELNSEFTERLI